MGSRHCTECGHPVSERARFCEHCGAGLTPTAVPLRAPMALESRILDERAAIEGERKQVTVMYTDIVGSMELTRRLEDERWGLVLDRFLGIAASAVHRFEGTVNQFTGDGLMAVFGAPLAHEDHARRACLAVLELQRDAAKLAAELARRDGVEFAVRCGLNSGEVVVGSIGDDVHMDFVPIGNTTALGKRIEALAPPGSTAISASTAALVEGQFAVRALGEFELKGAGARQRVLELVGIGAAHTRLDATAATRGLSPLVGRDNDLAALESALAHVRTGPGRAVGIVGEPGVGKSRLVREFVVRCATRGLTVHSTGGVPHGRYVPFLPVLGLYRDLFGIGERDVAEDGRRRIEAAMPALDRTVTADLPLLYEFLGFPEPDRAVVHLPPDAHRRRLLDVAVRSLQAGGGREPAVLVLEDLQWFDDASAAYVEDLVEAVTAARILVVCTYRPDYGPAWANRGPHVELGLGPLDAEAADKLLAELLGADGSVTALAQVIQARTGGNPFFIEETVQALAENGHLTGRLGEYRLEAALERLVLPATVQAGLAARLDRLPAREKALVQTMSVIGKEIPGELLREVCPLAEGQLADAVDVLAGARLVVPHGARDYAFKHPLIQEVAYGSQLSERRAGVHQTVADAIGRAYPEGLDERAALIAHHWEASGHKGEAARWHARAAGWAEVRSPPDAMRHWRRVRDLAGELPEAAERDELASKARAGILALAWRLGMAPEDSAAIHAEGDEAGEQPLLDLNYAATLMHSGREREGLDLFRTVFRRAVDAGDPGLAITPALGVSYAAWLAGSLREAVKVIDLALQLAGDDTTTGAGVAFVCPYAHMFHHRGQALGYMGELARAREDFEVALALASRHGDPEVEPYSQANLAMLAACLGDVDTALDAASQCRQIAEQAGNAVAVAAASSACAMAEAAGGHFTDALARAGANLALVRHHRVGLYYEPLLLATIASCQLELGRPDEALTAAEAAVRVMDARGLTTCALPAPIALAKVLIATRGRAAAEQIDAVIGSASRVAGESGARIFEPHIRRQRAALARLRGDDLTAQREEAEAERMVAAMIATYPS